MALNPSSVDLSDEPDPPTIQRFLDSCQDMLPCEKSSASLLLERADSSSKSPNLVSLGLIPESSASSGTTEPSPESVSTPTSYSTPISQPSLSQSPLSQPLDIPSTWLNKPALVLEQIFDPHYSSSSQGPLTSHSASPSVTWSSPSHYIPSPSTLALYPLDVVAREPASATRNNPMIHTRTGSLDSALPLSAPHLDFYVARAHYSRPSPLPYSPPLPILQSESTLNVPPPRPRSCDTLLEPPHSKQPRLNVKGRIKERKHECLVCHKRFFKLQDLRRHSVIHESDVRPFVCEKCGFSFKRKDSLQRHYRSKCSEATVASHGIIVSEGSSTINST